MSASPSPPAGPDPRLTLEPVAGRDVRPSVARPRAGLSGGAIALIAGAAALGLFGVLEARREKAMAPAVTRSPGDVSGSSASPPPLYLPPQPAPTVAIVPTPVPRPVPSPIAQPTSRPLPEPVRVLPSYPVAPAAPAPAAPAPPRNAGGAALVLDTSSPGATADEPQDKAGRGSGGERPGGLSTTRVRAAMFANRSTTVPQGTLIPAVLETAFDSTGPGFARALVQKDIHGFDGTRILIPRGSRLIGEFGGDTARGQRRAFILWSRLIRPDGVTIAIGSPAADPRFPGAGDPQTCCGQPVARRLCRRWRLRRGRGPCVRRG